MSNNFVIFADSACDIIPETLREWGVRCVDISFRFDHIDQDFTVSDISVEDFYTKMREGCVAKTAAANIETFCESFEPVLAEGSDILYLGFSSGLSTTFKQSCLAAEDLREKYPDRKIITVDSLSASAGYGLMLKMAVDKKNEGATLEETAAYAESLTPRMAHWFTVEDLVYLKRGGRVSPTAALVGNILSIKPILHMDNEGHLIKVTTARGRKGSLKALADHFFESAVDPANGKIFISHGDSLEDAQYLANLIRERGGNKVELITPIGAVIGAHSGPGTLAVFFIAGQR